MAKVCSQRWNVLVDKIISGGESIKEINRKSGAFVEVDKSYAATNPSVNEKVFKLRGTPEQIILAQQLMYEKVANGPGGPGDTLPPLQFQQQFNLPLVGTNSVDSWNASASDPYSNGANSADPYSSWTNYSQQWSQCRTKKLGFYLLVF